MTEPERRCRRPGCTFLIVRRPAERPYVFANRKFCSRACHHAGMTRRGAIRPATPLFPHAHVRYRRDAPDRCACGNPWTRQTENGLACIICGRECIIAEILLATQRRGLTLGRLGD